MVEYDYLGGMGCSKLNETLSSKKKVLQWEKMQSDGMRKGLLTSW